MRSIRWLAAGVLCLTASACFRPESTTCSGGQVCPPGYVCSSDGTQCITENALCGNGKIDALPDGGMEACDDGNVTNEPAGTPNSCRADCTGTGSCGDGRVDDDIFDQGDGGAREVCDPNDPVQGAECEPDCRSFRVCGNGITDDGGVEVCDDGNTVGGDGCSADCRSDETCGNTVRDVFPDGGSELCDDGNTQSGDGCRGDCYGLEVCGDGHRDMQLVDGGTEACDDGNKQSGDGCRGDCLGTEECGDALLDSMLLDGGSEACDHGAANGTDGTCGPTCRMVNCGNGIKELRPDGGLEECDNGGLNGSSFIGPDGQCNTQCVRMGCGNHVSGDYFIDGGREDCDEGVANGQPDSGCGPTCLNVVCGNGVRDWDEACDDGNTVSDDGCSADCRSDETCGNGIKDVRADGGGEICDDGNRDAGDGCSEICTAEVCGDRHKDPIKVDGGSEECDDLTGNNGTALSNCGPTCLLVGCGNGVVDSAWLEVCDDGNTDPVGTVQADGGVDNCASDCRSTGSCGNNVIDTPVGEQCDNGPGNNADSLLCTSTCKLAFCGDALVLDGGEQCDDGRETTGCNLNCTLARCGDGIVNATRGEQCDVQDAGVGPYETTACDLDCTVAFCGDGTVNARRGELCDTSGNSGTCDSDCTPNVCGDSFLNPFAKPDGGVEQCDTGGNTAFCDSDCTARVCGDGFTNDAGGEQCDDGNAVETDACLSTCVFNVCGDGKQRVGVELCDDGANNIDGGSPVCPYGYTTCTYCTKTCSVVNGTTGGVCGDSVTNVPNEACDFGGANGASACPYSSSGTCTGCSSNCQAQYSLTGPKCGDGRVDALPDGGIESCDDGSLSGNDGCASCVREPGWTFTGTTVGATTVATAICGDGLRVGPEICDQGVANGGTNCAYGDPGCAICNTSCTALVAGATHRCGDGALDIQTDGGVEACDDGNVSAGDGCASCTITSGWTCSGTPSVCATICGDGKRVGNEECDVGSGGNTTACNNCNEMPGWNCTENAAGLSTCVAKQCGDGIKAGAETCDDGNTVNGDGCNSSCTTQETGWSCATDANGRSVCTPICGDGLRVGSEACDDRNTATCGTCNSTCTATQTVARAYGYVGSFNSGDMSADGGMLTLSDGVTSLDFRLLTNCTGYDAGLCVQVTGSDSSTRSALRSAINAVPSFDITTSNSDGSLYNDHTGTAGNVPIVVTGVPDIFLLGMSGGSGEGCTTGVSCNSNSDCESGNCTGSHVCQ